MKRSVWMAFLMLVLGIGWLGTTAWSQQPFLADPNLPRAKADPALQTTAVASPPTESPVDDAIGEPAREPAIGGYQQKRVVIAADRMRGNVDQAFSSLVQKLRAADNDQAKAPVIAQLKKILETAFDFDLKRREKEVSEIEGRVRKLRDQIEKRKKAKEDIITLRLKTIANEADGLGFPTLNGAGNMRDGSSFSRMQSFRPRSGGGKVKAMFDSPEIESR